MIDWIINYLYLLLYLFRATAILFYPNIFILASDKLGKLKVKQFDTKIVLLFYILLHLTILQDTVKTY